jgi:hypothetical protein
MEIEPKYCDVIRKRYWKLVNGTEEGWAEGTELKINTPNVPETTSKQSIEVL